MVATVFKPVAATRTTTTTRTAASRSQAALIKELALTAATAAEQAIAALARGSNAKSFIDCRKNGPIYDHDGR